jgi:phage terminase large subunit
VANDINIYEAYLPLFQSKTRYTIVTGGRGSGKSFALACAVLLSTYDDPYNILYTRYTLVSADVSIIPEYTEKIDLMERLDDFKIKQREVENVRTGANILFRGLKTSSKNQIAKLKSLNKIKTWVLDEAQELVDESLFDTIDLSIREKDADNRVILVMNPDSVSHWIYRRFFIEAGVPEGFNGVKGNVTYIHTTYEDNLENLDDTFVEIADSLKERNPRKWEHIFGGKWLIRKEGLIYQRWEEIKPDQYPVHLEQWYGNDWGYGGDPNALIRMCFDAVTQTIYLWEVCCKQMLVSDVARALKEDAEKIGYNPYDCLVYCDPARPDNIAELRRRDISAVSAVNRDKSGRISYLQGFKVKYVGESIRNEVNTYSWLPHPQDAERFSDKPQDGNDHCMDAVSYGVVTHLRRMGIVNEWNEA